MNSIEVKVIYTSVIDAIRLLTVRNIAFCSTCINPSNNEVTFSVNIDVRLIVPPFSHYMTKETISCIKKKNVRKVIVEVL